jgi:hypothetical protein
MQRQVGWADCFGIQHSKWYEPVKLAWWISGRDRAEMIACLPQLRWLPGVGQASLSSCTPYLAAD